MNWDKQWLEKMYSQLRPRLRATDPIGGDEIGYMIEITFDGMKNDELSDNLAANVPPGDMAVLLASTLMEYVVLRAKAEGNGRKYGR